MLNFMARSTIKFHQLQGDSNSEIARKVKHHRKTVAKVLAGPLEPNTSRNRISSVAVFEGQIQQWLEQKVQVKRMLELARADANHPYTGKITAFYDYVRKVRRTRQLKAREIAVRFEGMAGEFLQIDWGEVHKFPFTKAGMEGQTKYFFAARLKYSRFMFVRFAEDMVEETLVRCLIDCFLLIGGVPWVVTTDNMKTVVIGRDAKHRPIWNPIWQKLAVEFQFHPEACWPASGNQKGAVENLVKYTKANFLGGRTFYDDEDLALQLQDWLQEINNVRECSATKEIPVKVLPQEQLHFGKLPPQAQDYGLFESLVVNREGVVTFQTNKYSVPANLVGQALTARIHRETIRFYAGAKEVASHPRCRGRNQRIVQPEHYEAAFETKPRARVMVYRDWLVGLGPVAEEYVRVICRKQRSSMNQQILTLYGLAQSLGVADFLVALELATEQAIYGAEYVVAIAAKPGTPGAGKPEIPEALQEMPQQAEVERPLVEYERFVTNLLPEPELTGMEQRTGNPDEGFGIPVLAGLLTHLELAAAGGRE